MKKRSFPNMLFIASLLSFLFSMNIASAASESSGIHIRDTSVSTCSNLDLLCRVWGFVKYYHPAIESNQFDMDAELFSILPTVLNAKNEKQRAKILIKWISLFGAVSPNRSDTLKYSILPSNEWLRDERRLGKNLSGILQKIERAKRCGISKYVRPDEYGYTSFAGEAVYDSIPFSDTGYRLLTLFRFWNGMKYYFPYIHLTDKKWDTVLTYLIPQFIKYTSDDDYYLLMCKMVTTLCDSHANLTSEEKYETIIRQKLLKRVLFPVKAQFIDSNLIISNLLDSTAFTEGFRLGDIIKRVDGKPVCTYFNELAKFTAYSNYSYFVNLFSPYYLSTNKTISMLDIVRDDTLKQIQVDATKLKKLYTQFDPITTSISKNGYAFINDSIGYIYPGTMTFEKEDTAMIKLRRTKGIIIDMRGYPKEFFWRTPQHFIPDSIGGATIQLPAYQLPGAFIDHKVCMYNTRGETIAYPGKIVVLVNHQTISQAEYITMWLQSIPGTVTIGTQTAGADGGRKKMPLPYQNTGFYFTSQGVIYPDGTITQRRGVKIDKIMNPTPQGLREGRDEILEEAIRMIQQENSVPIY